jgi:hypothetical protein
MNHIRQAVYEPINILILTEDGDRADNLFHGG